MSNLERVAQFNLIKELYTLDKISYEIATEYTDKLSTDGLIFVLEDKEKSDHRYYPGEMLHEDSYEDSYDSYDSYDE